MSTVWKAGTRPWKSTGGRNHHGKITVRHRGGGVARRLREVTSSLPYGCYYVRGLEYDPHRTALLAWVEQMSSTVSTVGGESEPYRAFVIASEGLRPGSYFYVLSDWSEALTQGVGHLRTLSMGAPLSLKEIGPRAVLEMPTGVSEDVSDLTSSSSLGGVQGLGGHYPGYRLPLRAFPLGSMVCALGSTWSLAGGTSGKILERDVLRDRVRVKQPSGEVRWMEGSMEATLGRVALHPRAGEPLGKAGVSRRLGRRPTVRGVAMNPVDHPHGGGEGRSSGGRPSVTPWGRPTKGQPTRRKAWHPWVVTPRLRAWQKK